MNKTDFPILKQIVHKQPLVYLDNAATSQKPQVVIDAIVEAYSHWNSNIHRGVHHLSQVATKHHEEAREKIAQFIHAKSSEEIIFTKGTTDSINTIAFCLGEQPNSYKEDNQKSFIGENDEIIVSGLEHHSNIVPWQMLCQRKKMSLRIAPINDDGELLTENMYELFNEHTRLVAVTHISNVMGSVNPIEEIISKAHSMGIPVMVDAAQSIPHKRIDVKALDCVVFSGHKMYAPNGSGALYGKEKYLEEMVPYHGGGEMIDKVTFAKTTYNTLPFKFEAGTPDYIAAAGLATAIEFMQRIGLEAIEAHEQDLLNYCIGRLREIDDLRLIGDARHHSGAVSFLVGNIHFYDMGMILDKMGIAVRTGHHCAQPLMERFGISGTVRASFAIYNTREEVDKLIEGVKRVQMMF